MKYQNKIPIHLFVLKGRYSIGKVGNTASMHMLAFFKSSLKTTCDNL